MKTMKETTEEWMETQAEWVGLPLHAPAVSLLLHIADQIDNDPSKASLISQYGLAYRSLIAERPKEEAGLDDLDLLLRNSVGEGVSMS